MNVSSALLFFNRDALPRSLEGGNTAARPIARAPMPEGRNSGGIMRFSGFCDKRGNL